MASRRLLISYICEWLMIILAAAIALTLSSVNPDYHHFSLLDLSISYPHRVKAKVGLGLFLFLAIVFPIVTIVFVSIYDSRRSTPPDNRKHWHQSLWHMNASLLGLGVSLVTSTIIFTGVKNLSGKPRPDFLARCDPDLEHITAHTVGGYGQTISNLWVMVDGGICQQPDRKFLNDGFRSFPSGYATSETAGMKHCMLLTLDVVAFAGLWYLSLFVAARFDVVPPSAIKCLHRRDRVQESDETGEALMQSDERVETGFSSVDKSSVAPPAYLIPLPYVPLGLAIFLAGTRYFDFRNHGFDVLVGSAVGTITAWFGFRLYHPPLASHLRGSLGGRNDQSVFPGGD